MLILKEINIIAAKKVLLCGVFLLTNCIDGTDKPLFNLSEIDHINQFNYEILKDTINYYDKIDLIESYLKRNPDLTIKDKKGNTILHRILQEIYCDPELLDSVDYTKKIKDTIVVVTPHQVRQNLYAIYNLYIPNLNGLLNIENNKKMTPLYSLFKKFHPIQPNQIAKRLIERIRNVPNDINSDINLLIDYIAIEQKVDIVFTNNHKNLIERIFSEKIEYEHLVTIDNSLSPLKAIINQHPFYDINKKFCQLVPTKEYVSRKVKKKYKVEMLNLLMALKVRSNNYRQTHKLANSVNTPYTLPPVLKKYLFELIWFDPLYNSLENIITKRKEKTPITEDDLICLKNAAKESPLFQK